MCNMKTFIYSIWSHFQGLLGDMYGRRCPPLTLPEEQFNLISEEIQRTKPNSVMMEDLYQISSTENQTYTLKASTMHKLPKLYYTGMRFFRNSGIFPTSEVILVSYLWGGGVPYMCVLADRQQCWNGTTYILLIINLF